MIKFINTSADPDKPYTPIESIEMCVNDESSLPDIIEAFEGFLKASGYNWDGDQHLDFVSDHEILWNNKDVKYDVEKLKFSIVE